MSFFWAVFLGILQGLTEFLPVSSSGHLVIVQSLIPGFSQPGVFFDVILHAGTLFAVIFYFRRTILKLKTNYLLLLFIGTLPAGLFGYLFQDSLEGFFSDIKLVGVALLLTGIINFLTDKAKPVKSEILPKDSFLVGLAQAIAIIPGISRSGATIFEGSLLGIDKEKAAEFSFLLSIPAIIGANLLQFLRHGLKGDLQISFYIIGFLAAAISGYLAINFAVKLLLARKFRYFGFYCLLIGVVAVLFL